MSKGNLNLQLCASEEKTDAQKNPKELGVCQVAEAVRQRNRGYWEEALESVQFHHNAAVGLELRGL